MYDQSFNYISIARMLRKNDFYVHPHLRSQTIKEKELEDAAALSTQGFAGYNFLSSTLIRGKNVYRIPKFSDELVLRKIDRNLRKAKPLYSPSRDTIIAKLSNLLAESVQCKIYRLDIKSFYESLDTSLAINEVNAIKSLSPQTKKFIKDILDNFASTGGRGLPRGLAISATLSEIVMNSFDGHINSLPNVFFYCRYVDDIIVITSGTESSKQFIKNLSESLPSGLLLNKKKEDVCPAPDSTPFKPTAQNPINQAIYSLEYLGYSFSVYEPAKKFEPREVVLDIAESKIKKIKTRLTKAYIDYNKNKDFGLLELRMKFLTSNFSVMDINRGGYRLAGIFHNYHRISFSKSSALDKLDVFLKTATLSSYGKVFYDFYCNTNSLQRRRLLTFSFKKGFRDRTYMHFSRSQFTAARECWEYA
ncbi:antiviral reverse transcriptase Drt3a [Pseudomonas sp. URMO17WK12:I4]|uniref:antiviral reverse transcriptase Drt3a n=1 Tax=Pseudomonas sp. URMO17WK12:I4 TaxID=1283292 RepID=UPI0004BCB455|nr:antiviral reverse transcriptase Drt3a [Pseudomonas sp. URMO17WK12:I4]